MSLFSSLKGSAEAMQAIERGLAATQNNVANVSTPGFARQQQTFLAKRFQPEIGITGGVQSGPVVSSRNPFVEEAVWRQQHTAGQFEQQRASLASIEPVFSVQNGSGIAASLDRLFQSFSQLTVAPNDTTARLTLLERAGDVARNFNQTASSLTLASQNTDRQLSGVVAQINDIGARLAKINSDRRSMTGAVDPGTDAALHAALEDLAKLTDFTSVENANGSVTVDLGGETLFVIGDRHYDISLSLTGGSAEILNSDGQIITSQFEGGQITALTNFRNSTLPSYLADVDALAKSVADEINTTLAAGVDQNGAAPTVNLFAYSTTQSTAATISVNNLQPSELALALPAAPGGNGNAIQLAALANQTLIGGETFNGYYSSLASQVGRDLTTARQSETTHSQLLTQARTLRQELSGVSLDEEAAMMLQFQRSYQAVAQMFRAVNEMTEELLNIAR